MATATVTPRHQKTLSKAADSKNMVDTLLDFSFFNITDPADVEGEEPREQPGRHVAKEIVLETNEDGEEVEVEKYKATCVRLCNNLICEHGSLMKILTKMVVDPLGIFWIDLSVNEISKIDPIICEFDNLSLLYLHGNSISDINEVEKLGKLPKLYKLSLHCNPISSAKNYRSHVLSVCPNLKSFDMSPITKSDRATAAAYSKSNLSGKKKKKSSCDE